MVKNITGQHVGADDVYPIFIYTIIKGNIRKLKSNLSYIELYRHKTRLESHEEYYFTTITSAVEFIESITGSSLNITEKEFADRLQQEKQRYALEKEKESQGVVFKSNHLNITS